MRVLAYTWAGVRTTDLKSASHFFAEVLGLSIIYEGEGLVQFEMPSGQLFEVFGRENRYYQLHACPVLAFQVEDEECRRKRHATVSSGKLSMRVNQLDVAQRVIRIDDDSVR
jgi:hypothetical protein